MTISPSAWSRGWLRFWTLTVVTLCRSGLLDGQTPAPTTTPDHHTVYLVTFGPGPAVWERFGHNALWIRDTVTGRGVAYDFGRFDFAQSGFLWRVARGEMAYWMGRADGGALIDVYTRLDRSVTLQELALGPAARIALQEALETNFARDSGVYRYDYYRDNCSTRIRDQIDQVIGGALGAYLQSTPSNRTLRDHTRRSLDNNLMVYFAAMAVLGPSTDRPITGMEESFLPGLLQEHIRGVQIVNAEGEVVPLVRREIQIAESEHYSVPGQVSRGPTRVFAALGLGVGALLLTLGLLARRHASARWAFFAATALWQVFVAIAALLIIWLWGFSDHVVAYRNANVMHFTLTGLVLLGLTPGMMRGDAGRLRAGRFFARLALLFSVVGVLLALLPVLAQQLGEVSALAFPVHAAVLVGLESITRSRSLSPS